MVPIAKAFRWLTGARKGKKSSATFARVVNHPGSKGQHPLRRAMQLSSSRAGAAWANVVADELAKIPSPGAAND